MSVVVHSVQCLVQNAWRELWVPLCILFNGQRDSFVSGKGAGREFDHSPPSTALVKDEYSYASTRPICLYGKERNIFTFAEGLCFKDLLPVSIFYCSATLTEVFPCFFSQF